MIRWIYVILGNKPLHSGATGGSICLGNCYHRDIFPQDGEVMTRLILPFDWFGFLLFLLQPMVGVAQVSA